LYATLDGLAQCRFCGEAARLDLFSRWILACVVSLVLSAVLLYGGLFYSGHLFVISISIIFSAWAVLCWVGFPLLSLEAVPRASPLDRSKAVLILVALLVAATLIDSFMASRFEPGG
jgi:hypothetical protein